MLRPCFALLITLAVLAASLAFASRSEGQVCDSHRIAGKTTCPWLADPDYYCPLGICDPAGKPERTPLVLDRELDLPAPPAPKAADEEVACEEVADEKVADEKCTIKKRADKKIADDKCNDEKVADEKCNDEKIVDAVAIPEPPAIDRDELMVEGSFEEEAAPAITEKAAEPTQSDEPQDTWTEAPVEVAPVDPVVTEVKEPAIEEPAPPAAEKQPEVPHVVIGEKPNPPQADQAVVADLPESDEQMDVTAPPMPHEDEVTDDQPVEKKQPAVEKLAEVEDAPRHDYDQDFDGYDPELTDPETDATDDDISGLVPPMVIEEEKTAKTTPAKDDADAAEPAQGDVAIEGDIEGILGLDQKNWDEPTAEEIVPEAVTPKADAPQTADIDMPTPPPIEDVEVEPVADAAPAPADKVDMPQPPAIDADVAEEKVEEAPQVAAEEKREEAPEVVTEEKTEEAPKVAAEEKTEPTPVAEVDMPQPPAIDDIDADVAEEKVEEAPQVAAEEKGEEAPEVATEEKPEVAAEEKSEEKPEVAVEEKAEPSFSLTAISERVRNLLPTADDVIESAHGLTRSGLAAYERLTGAVDATLRWSAYQLDRMAVVPTDGNVTR